MDAEGWPGLGRWWWPRQGPWWPRGGAQEQRQAAFERPQGAGRRGSTPETRPRSPVKGKPATRRPPAGPRIDYPGPLGWGVRLRGAQARAGPMQGRHRVIHSPTAGRNAAARAVAARAAEVRAAAARAVVARAAAARAVAVVWVEGAMVLVCPERAAAAVTARERAVVVMVAVAREAEKVVVARAAVARAVKQVVGARVAAMVVVVAQQGARDPADELRSPHTQRTVWQWQTLCKARSGLCQQLCTHLGRLGLRRAKCGRSTRSRRSPRRTARTLAPYRGSSR